MSPTFQLIDSGWDKILGEAVGTNCTELRVVCPFIKVRTAKRLLASNRPDSIQVITRFHLGEMCVGVNDTEALRLLLENGAKIRGVRGLHAKLYLFGTKRAVVTSANLTEAALLRNHEFGFVTNEDPIITRCREYFDRLWQRAGIDLDVARLEGWEKKINAIQLAGSPPSPTAGLKDEGADAGQEASGPIFPTDAIDAPGAYVKFFGQGNDRESHDFPILEEVQGSGSHWACTYPANKRPRSVKDGDVMFMARLVDNPEDIMVYGRALAFSHVDGRDDATPAEIAFRNWKKDWPAYVRVHGAEFVAGPLKNGVRLSALMDELKSDAFASTQRNKQSANGENTDPRRALMQKAHMQLTNQAYAWLEHKLQRAFDTHGKLTPAELENLDWPKVDDNRPKPPAGARRMLKVLADYLLDGVVDVSNPKTFPSYKDTLLAMGITPWEGARLGPQFDREGGDALNKWLKEQQLPALTGLVVNRDSSIPGGQYFTSNDRPKEDYEWWMSEMERAAVIVWSNYI